MFQIFLSEMELGPDAFEVLLLIIYCRNDPAICKRVINILYYRHDHVQYRLSNTYIDSKSSVPASFKIKVASSN